MTERMRQLFGIETPIILAPFGGLSSVELTVLVSQRGGLGSYGLYGYSPETIRETVTQIRSKTSAPFAVNLWLPTGDEVKPDPGKFEKFAAGLEPLFSRLELELPSCPDRFLPDFEEQIEATLELKPPTVSFVFGVPPGQIVERAQSQGTRIIGTATTVDEALALESGGVDAIVAAGAEGAGHRVSFLERAEESLVGTIALVPQVADAVSVPVIAAGGIADRRGVAAAFALGAEAVQVGTSFLRTRQSAANDAYRRAIENTPAHGSVLTRAMSGRLARGAPNQAIREIEESDVIAPFPAQNWLTGQFRKVAAGRDLAGYQSLWMGQASSSARFDDADELFDELARGIRS